MRGKNKYLGVLVCAAALSTLPLFPTLEQEVRASVESQSNASAHNQKSVAAAKATTASVTNKAVEAQLAAKGIKFKKLTPKQRKNVYVDVIVQLKASPAATNGSVSSGASTGAIERASKQVIAAQSSVKRKVESITKQAPGKSFGYVVNAFSTKVKVKDIQKLRDLPEVKSVTLARVFYPTDDSSDNMANVSTVWNNYKYRGQGTVVSIIDTGIDPNHKDMRLSAGTKVKLSASDVDKFTSAAGYGRYFTRKVPYGHNYADNNDIIADNTQDEQHGMHVAGIVGANGTGSNPASSVKGVAPEAQLLAMKVFSNSSSLSTTDSTSIIGAIDDSSKLGADVLNMSLGSTAGEQTESDPEDAAVDRATKKGTAAVISAGNSGTTNSEKDGTNKAYYGNPDMGTIGTPGTARTATTVASAENKMITTDGVTVTANGKKLFGPSTTQLAQGTDRDFFSNKHFFITKGANGQLGTGAANEYNSSAKGKIAIVRRGDLTFTDKQKYAQQAGCAGLIMVNNQGGDLPLTNAQLNAGFPTMTLSTNDGNTLVSYLKAHPNATLNIAIRVQPLANQERKTDLMSDFTSYGPDPDLSFKPDITAPGGNIWSTQNNNTYTNMSGTSMASPFIAGTQAVLKQAMNDSKGKFYNLYQHMTGEEKDAFMKNIEMNTATIETDVSHNGVIESPRRQGAGMVNAEAAVDAIRHNPSTVTGANGYPGVELKDFKNSNRQFVLKFTNRTNKPLTYHLNRDGKMADVYTSATDPSTAVLYEKSIAGASVTANNTITIPAHSTKDISFTLNLPSGLKQGQYVEGFLTFTGSDNSVLRIPYMGFYGDWTAPAAFDNFNGVNWNPNDGDLGTLVTGGKGDTEVNNPGLYADKNGNLKVNPNNIAFSKDPHAQVNWIRPQYYTFRNLNNVKAEILDSKGKVVDTLATLSSVPKSYYESNAQSWVKFDSLPNWDGSYFNAQANKEEKVPDGVYTYRVLGTIDGTHVQKHFDFKVKVDSVKPVLRNLQLKARSVAVSGKKQTGSQNGKASQTSQSNKVYYLSGEAKDNLSGLDGTANVSVNGVEADNVNYTENGKTADGFTKIEIPLSAAQVKALQNGNNSFSVAVFDNATNAGTASGRGLKPGATSFGLVLDGGQLPDKITSHTENYDGQRDQFTFKGTFLGKVYGTYTDASGEQHDLLIDYDNSDNEFTAKLPVSRKDYKTTVKLYTDADHQTQLYSKQIAVSVLPAQVKSLKVDGTSTYTAGRNEKPALGETSENSVTVSGTVSADTSKVTLTNGSHTVNATVNTKNHTFSAKVPLGFGDNRVVVTASDADGNSSSVTQVINSSDRGATTVAVSDIHFDNGISFRGNTVNASTKNYDPKTGKLVVTGKLARPTTTLTIGGQEVRAKSDGSFSVTLNVGKHGRVVFPVFVGDITQSTILQDRLEFDVDSEAPTVTIDGNHDIDTTKNQYTIKGTITDDHLAYNLFINGNQVEDGADDVNYNDSTKLNKKFQEKVDLKPGKNTFHIWATDVNGNESKHVTLVINYDASDKSSMQKAKDELQALIHQAKQYYNIPANAALYTDDSIATLRKLGHDDWQKFFMGHNYSLSDVQKAITTLQNALKNLVKKSDVQAAKVKAAKANLQKLVDKANNINTSKDTADSVAAFKVALQNAKATLADDKANLSQVQASINDLLQAQKNLKAQNNQSKDQQALTQAKSKLQKLIHKAKSYYFGDSKLKKEYTTASITKLANESESDYYNVYMNPKATLRDVQAALSRLQKALDGLVKKTPSSGSSDQKDKLQAAKDSLKQTIASARNVNTSKDTDDSVEAFEKALKAAQTTLDDSKAKLTDLQAAENNLKKAQKGLKVKASQPASDDKALAAAKAALQKVIDSASKVDSSSYTNDSVKALTDAVNAAKKALEDKQASVSSLQKAAQAITTAQQNLKAKTNSGADQTLKEAQDELAKVIDEANKVNTANAANDPDQKAVKDALSRAESLSKDKNAKANDLQKAARDLEKALLQKAVDDLKNKDLGHYTDDSASALRKALRNAQAKLDDSNAKVADLEAARQALKSANEGLVAKTDNPSKPSQGTKPDDNKGQTGNQSGSGNTSSNAGGPITSINIGSGPSVSVSANENSAQSTNANSSTDSNNENVEPHAQAGTKAKNTKVRIRLIHNAYVYNQDGHIVRKNNKRLLLKKKQQHSILAWNNAKVTKIKGKRYYQVGSNQFVKIANTALNDKVGRFTSKKLRAKIVASKGSTSDVVTTYSYRGNKKGSVKVGTTKTLDGYRDNLWTVTAVKGQRAYKLAGSHQYVLAENLKFLK